MKAPESASQSSPVSPHVPTMRVDTPPAVPSWEREGAAATATSFAGARAYRRLGLPAVPLYALAAAMAASRVVLRVHHLSDVLAGAVLGTLIAR